MTGDEVQVRLAPGTFGVSAQDLVAMGEDLAALGLTETRAVMAELQEVATKVAVASGDVFLGKLRKVVVARDAQLIRTILALPLLNLPRMVIGTTPYINRDSVLALIQASSTMGARQ